MRRLALILFATFSLSPLFALEATEQQPIDWQAYAQNPRKHALALQAKLAREGFSCGTIDGIWGKQSEAALEAWQAHAQSLTKMRLTEVPDTLTHTISEADIKRVTGPMPKSWAERSELRYLGYATLIEAIAEHYHTSPRALARLNKWGYDKANWPTLALGQSVIVPNAKASIKAKAAKVVIDIKRFYLRCYDQDDRIIAHFPCSIARNKQHLPQETALTVRTLIPNPNYTYNPANYIYPEGDSLYIIYPGPRNPVGVYWIGLSLPSYGLHGSPSPYTIGRAESRGCFRLTNWDIQTLAKLLSINTPVQIVASTPPKLASPTPTLKVQP